MSIDIVGAVTGVCKFVGPTLIRQCGYIVSCNSHASALKHEIKNLRDASTRLRHKVDHADSVGDVIEDDVWTWLTEAENLIKEKNLILEKDVVSYCFGFVPNPKARYVLGKRAKKSLPDLRALIERGKFDGVSYHPVAELGSELKVRSATATSSTVRYVDLKSRALVLKRIMADLTDHDKVGVYGMGGVGKTTLLRDVEKRARESGKFDDVVTVYVSQAPNSEGIKSKIRNKLGSLGSNEANKKTLLVLLDDLWSKLKDIENLKEDNVKVKWVMTSRKQELLATEMDCYSTISLGVLEEEEVWSFFGELVKNNQVEEMKNNPAVAALLKKCAGLPVSIEALAKVLEKKGLSSSDLVMEDVLKLGKESIDGSASLELSYNYLGDSDAANLARSLFRIIGLLGTPTVPILILLKYTIGLGLLGGSSSSSSSNESITMERARRQVTSSLRMLQNASLLLESDDSDYVKIHDVVRAVAASIASRDDRALIFNSEDNLKGGSQDDIPMFNEEAGAAQGLPGTNNIMDRARRHLITSSLLTSSLRMLQDASLLLGSDDSDYVKIHDVVRDFTASITSRSDDRALIFDPEDDGLRAGWSKEKLKKSRSVYLPYSVIPKLNERLDCSELSILIMEAGTAQGDQDLSRHKNGRGRVQLPSSFYKGMVKLKVLDLRNAWLSSLSLSTLSDLHNLTTLFLHFCCIYNVSVIGKLENLQILSFVGSDLAYLPKEIGDLTKLKILDLSQCSELKRIEPGTLIRLKRLEELYIKESFEKWEVKGAKQPRNPSLDELNHLPQLRTLEVCVPNTNTLPSSLPLGALARYKVLIGDSWDWSSDYKESRTLKFKENSKKSILTEDWLQSALQTTEDLYLDGLSGAGGSFHEQCKERFKKLKHLHLQNSSSIQYVIWSTEWLACSAFMTLESMILEKMDSLEKICHGLINPTSFSKLKVIRVENCHKLTNLFNLSLVDSLTKLEEIEVSDCKEVREIVTAEEILEDHKEGMKGCPVNLLGCTNKRSTGMARAPYVIKLGNLRCLTLRNLPKLRTFLGNEALSESMKTTGHVLLNDQKGALHGCKCKKLVPASRHKKILPNTHLELDKLQRLELADCDAIAHFLSSSMLLKLVNLESLSIARCQSLEDIFDLNGVDATSRNVKILPKLSELKLRELPKLVQIWKKNDMLIKGCQSLRTVEIYQCNSLMYLCSSSMCEGMENLTEIRVGHCNKMKAVFGEKGLKNNASSVTTGLRSLKTLVISHCKNLKAFLEGSKNGMPYWCYGNQADDHTSSFFSQKVFLPNLESLIISSGGDFEKLWCIEVPAKSYCNLEFIHIEYCQNLLTVLPATLIERLQKLKHLLVNDCKKLETVINLDVLDRETSKKKPKFLMLPQLQKLKLESLDILQRLIKTNSGDEIVVGFPNLKRVEVLRCHKLTHLIPAATATTLLKLEELEIKVCARLEEVVYGKVSERNKMNDFITFPHLTSLTMDALDCLTCFCSESYSFDFTCLKVLSVYGCYSLKMLVKPRSDGHYLGSRGEDEANTGTQAFFNDKVRLPNLESLTISRCGSVEELWCEEPPTGSFCKLQGLAIWECPGLRNIIPSFVIKRLQVLKIMNIWGCEQVEDIINITSTQQILSVDDSGNSVLEGCTIEESIKESRRVIDGRIALTELTTLELCWGVKLGNLLSGRYILELPSLKQLILPGTTTETTTAILEKVHFPNVEELEIPWNEETTELWHSEPPTGSFNKLKTLIVRSCTKLIKVIPLFMLKRLQNLEKLVVDDCESLETVCELGGGGLDKHVEETGDSVLGNLTSVSVVKCESLRILFSFSGRHHENEKATTDDSTNNIIVLPWLYHLRLENLPNFEHLFHVLHGQYILQLSSLEDFLLIEAGAKEAVTQKVVFSEELTIREHDINFFGSTSTVMKQIMEALKNNHHNQTIIGLHGFPDTYLLAELERQVKEEAHLFDELVLSERDDDAKSIQEEIGKKLGIIYETTEEQGRAETLEKRLLSNRHIRLLFILHVPGKIDLEAVGIPRQGLDPRFFKQIFVSQDRTALVQKGAQPVIDIGDFIGQRFRIFEEEVLSERDSKEPQADTTKDTTFLVGSKTNENIFSSFVGAVSPNSYTQIIGIRGSFMNNQRLLMGLSYALRYGNGEGNFDEVVYLYWKYSAPIIQERLGSRLGITYDEGSGITERAERLRETLLSHKYKRLLLIIVTNLVEDLNLEAVGIPEPGVLDPKLFRIILVSQKIEVLQHHTDARYVVEIENISHLWWFQTIADECGCDYLTRLLAKKLKGKGFPAWKYALERLQDSPFKLEAREKVVDSLQVNNFFGSASSIVKQIMEALQNNQNNQTIIGLLGKMDEYLIAELERQVMEEAHLFDEVVVLLNPGRNYAWSIQEELRQKLGIIYGTDEEPARAETLEKSLLSNRHIRLLFILYAEDTIMDVEAMGIPRQGLDPRFFKQMLLSEDGNVLVKMGAQLVIDVGNETGIRYSIFQEELGNGDYKKPQVRAMLGIPVLVGSTTISRIMEALENHPNHQIIGIHARYNQRLFMELSGSLKYSYLHFDEVVDLYGKNNAANIQERLGSRLGITYDEGSGITGRAQQLRESLSRNKDKRLLLIIASNRVDDLNLEAVGIPQQPGVLDPKFFKIMLVSEKREVLRHHMGAQYVAKTEDTSHFLWYQTIADECGCNSLAQLLARKLKGKGLPARKYVLQSLQDSPFEFEARKKVILQADIDFFESTSSIVKKIREALQNNQNNQGLLGNLDVFLLAELERQVKEEAHLFDELVLSTENDDAKSIQEELGRKLGITYETTEEQERAETLKKSLLSNCNKRLLFIFLGRKTRDLEAVGIPRQRLDPSFFRQIFVSQDKDVLVEMGAQLVIHIGDYIGDRCGIFEKEVLSERDSKVGFGSKSTFHILDSVTDEALILGDVGRFDEVAFDPKQKKQELQVDTTNNDFSFLVGSNTTRKIFNRIVEALKTHPNDHIIGIHGSYNHKLFMGLSCALKNKHKLFDEAVDLYGKNNAAHIQERLGSRLGITYDEGSGITGRAQHLCESLSRNKDKRLLLIIASNLVDDLNLEAVGIPQQLGVLDPKLFKIILWSEKREVLHHMGAQYVVKIGDTSHLWWSQTIADECGCLYLTRILASKLKRMGNGLIVWKYALKRLKNSPFEFGARKKVIDSLQVDFNFFGSASSIGKQITEALQNNQNNQTIIGLLGTMDTYLIEELERQVKEEAHLFDEVVVLLNPGRNYAWSIQEELGRKLGIIYGTTEEQGRAKTLENSLLGNRHIRLLFILYVPGKINLKAVGIPRQRLHSNFFKQIFLSQDGEALVEMGSQIVIRIGYFIGQRYHLFEEELRDSKVAFDPKQEPQVDTTNDISFLVGSKTTLNILNSIKEALRTHPNDQIIGILGSYNQRLFMELSFSLKYGYGHFDGVVDLYGKNNAANIQERLGSRLGITYDKRSGITGRAQQLRESLSRNKDKRLVLIIATDLVEDLNLEAVGIPQPGVLEPKLFKIILWSEKIEVLRHHMGDQYVEEIGDTSHLWWSHTIADECGCEYLMGPLARKLMGKGLPAWKYALQRLQDSPFELEAREKVVNSLFDESQESAGEVVFSEELKSREPDDINFFGSTTSVLKQIMEALQNNQNNQTIIGLLGSPDIYLLAELERQVKEEAHLFDELVLSTENDDAKSIQEELGRKLGIIYGTTESLEKSLLSNHNKRLLFICFVPRTRDLEAVGIPRQRLDPSFFRQIFVSQDKDVLVEMGAQLVIDIGDYIGDRCVIFEKEVHSERDSKVDTADDIRTRIVEALKTHPDGQIIGILGSYNRRLFMLLSCALKNGYGLEIFDEVVDLFGKYSAHIIQERLGSRLGITYDEGSGITERAQHLRRSLSRNKDKRLLLIIATSLVEDLNLEAVGIPQQPGRVLDPKLFKIMLVSEKREVLDHMGAQYVVEIGDISHLSLSHTIADECGCDYLVRLLARKLKGKGLPAWENALQLLQDSPFEYEARKKVVDSLFVSDGDDDEESQETEGGFPSVTDDDEESQESGQAKAGQASNSNL